MDYQKHYNKLIDRARNRILEGYVERHHIIPKCMDGSDDVVALTPEEHYLAHQLLIKIYPNESKLVFAAKMMTVKSETQIRNNKLYGWLRRKHAKIVSERMKGNIPWNKGKITPEEVRCKQSESHKGKKHIEEVKQKISNSLKGHTNGKGNIPWNKGIPCSEESNQKRSNSMKGRIPWNKGIKGYKRKCQQ